MSKQFLIYMQGLSFRERLRHWEGKKPWMFEGVAVRSNPAIPKISPSDITIHPDGSIRRMPKLPNLPCFGMPTAFIHHWPATLIRTKNGVYETRCGKCPAREGCAHVAKNNLRASPEIAEAYDAFEAAGGRDAYAKRVRGQGSAVSSKLGALYKALITHGPILSCNDAVVDQYVSGLAAKQRAENNRRQIAKRARDRQARFLEGNFDQKFLDQLDRERIFRYGQLKNLSSDISLPRPLTRGDSETSMFTANVWMCKFLVLANGKKPNASNVAQRMIDHKLSAVAHNSLRSKVARALTRIDACEQFTPPDSNNSIWPITTIAKIIEDGDI